MKNSERNYDLIIGKSVMLFLIVLIMFGFGCHKDQSATEHKGDPKATWNFWQIIQEPPPRNTLYHRIDGLSAENASQQDLAAMILVLRQMSESCRDKAGQITAANLANVDVDAANYGVKKAQLWVGYAKLFESAAQQTDKQSQLSSGEDWAFGYLFALGRHSGDGDDAWGNALKEELVDKAKTFGDLQVDGQNISAFAQNLADADADLKTVEMQTCIELNQRYGRAFPTSQELAAQNPAPAPVIIGDEKLKTAQQELMGSLVGRKIKTPADGTWTFEQDEFQTFEVTHGTNYGDALDFEIATHVKGNLSGAEHDFRLLMTYQKSNDAMTLMFVKPL